MKLTSASLFTGVCLAISALTAIPAYAVSSTAFSLFHVEGPLSSTENSYLCLGENNGAVVNNCTWDVSLEFNLPINSLGAKSISVQNLWGSPPLHSFTCTVYAFSGLTGSSYAETALAYNASSNSFNGSIDLTANGSSMQVICWNVPPGQGIANFNWNPF